MTLMDEENYQRTIKAEDEAFLLASRLGVEIDRHAAAALWPVSLLRALVERVERIEKALLKGTEG